MRCVSADVEPCMVVRLGKQHGTRYMLRDTVCALVKPSYTS
jgi:hypothetical protein